MDLSIVLPCYNEAESLPEIVAQYQELSVPFSWELILVDNGSTDTTAEVLDALAKQAGHPFLKIVRLPTNQGYGGGILAGLQRATGTFLAWSHADMQTPAKDVFAAYQVAQSTSDSTRTLVKGRRALRPLPEQLVTWGMQCIASACLRRILTDINAQPKLFHRSLLAAFDKPPQDFNLDLYLYHLALKSGFEVVTIPVVFGKRAHGHSRWAYSLRSKGLHISKTLRFIAELSRRNLRSGGK